jgi:hypothetical protein
MATNEDELRRFVLGIVLYAFELRLAELEVTQNEIVLYQDDEEWWQSEVSDSLVGACAWHSRSDRLFRALDPQGRELELEHLKRLDAHLGLVSPGPDSQPSVRLYAVGLERARERIDEPQVRDSFTRVDMHLVAAVDALRTRGDDLANPVGRKVDRRGRRHAGHALVSPACEVGHDDVLVEMQLGLVEENPATRAQDAAVERAPSSAPSRDAARACGIAGRGFVVEDSEEDLGDLVRRRVEDVLIGCVSANRLRHRA